MTGRKQNDDDPQEEGEGQRLPIWSVTRTEQALYFGLFSLFSVAGILFLLAYEVFVTGTVENIKIIRSIVVQLALVGGGAATLALTTVEAPKLVMVAARYVEDRWLKPLREKRKQEREKLRQEIREEVEQEVQARWKAWLTGMRQAQEKGEPFDEPPPGDE